ncbi:hypothetical protein F53441_8365 [Fusarium austroafricanum]|uniref:Uncharacterized protein n=1 Tax=Fusarium austroafricanum TaxID=2364996 RepID=A0A8H4KEC4_9HYPO|nr:hypothetical protein F53441_8365 [Fusarium austroafricanum]
MKSALSLAALVSPVIVNGNLGMGGNPSHNMTEQAWQSAFKNPNATGTYTFTAYNVSERFPPNKTVDGWTATIQVANITDDPDDDTPYPGIDIGVQAPDGMRVPALNSSRTNSSNWHVCIALWTPERLKDGTLNDAQHDDGDCRSFLDEDCIKALKSIGSGYYGNEDGCMAPPQMPLTCEKHFVDHGPTYGYGMGGNLSRFKEGRTMISERPDMTSRYNAMTEDEAYDYAVRGVWTVLINWGRRDAKSWDSGDVLQPTLLCLRARNITEGSEDPNAGVRTTVYGPMALFMALLASVLLIY